MAKYFQPHEIQDLIETRNRIFPERISAYQQHGIDILANDTLSSLSIYEIVSTYDAGYNINFARNGEDAISNGVKIEQKCCAIKKKADGTYPNATFMFHAMGDLEYPRYIFAARDNMTLQLLKLFDIKRAEHTKIVLKIFLNLKKEWLKTGAKSYDVIQIPESYILENIKFTDKKIINNCEVFID